MAPDLNNTPIRDTDKTRVYSADETRARSADETRMHAADETRVIAQSASERDVSIGNTLAYERAQKPGLFDGLSLAQIIAGAAAAATSVMLASQIGIAGSVIGAAVSSVVTVVSSQIYRRFITASADAIKSAHTKGGDAPADGWEAGASFERDANGQLSAEERAYPGARVAPERLRARAKAARAATQRKVIGFSVAAAVAAVGVCAAIILATTAGEGLGAKPAPLFSSQDSAQDERVDDATPPADDATPSTTTPETPDASTTKPNDDATEGGQNSGTATTPETPTDSDQDAADGDDQTTATTPGTGDGSTSGDGATDGANAPAA